jgi:hypothetical protein
MEKGETSRSQWMHYGTFLQCTSPVLADFVAEVADEVGAGALSTLVRPRSLQSERRLRRSETDARHVARTLSPGRYPTLNGSNKRPDTGCDREQEHEQAAFPDIFLSNGAALLLDFHNLRYFAANTTRSWTSTGPELWADRDW